MAKTKTLTQTGWMIHGYVFGSMWMGGEGIYPMEVTHVPLGKLTKSVLLDSIRERLGFQWIDHAHVYIDTQYGHNYLEYRDDIFLKQTSDRWEFLRDQKMEDKLIKWELRYEGIDDEYEEEE